MNSPNGSKSWWNRRLDDARVWLDRRYQTEFDAIKRQSELRSQSNELAMFAHPLIRVAVFLGALAVFLLILQFTAPPRGMNKAMQGKNILRVTRVEACFGEGCLSDSQRIHTIVLPGTDPESLTDYQAHDLYYRIKPSVTAEQIKSGLDNLLLPIPWGDAEAYRSGILVKSGLNFYPVIPLVSPNDEIVIHVKTPSGSYFGIRGIFPPFVTDRISATKLETEMYREPLQTESAFVAQLSGMCLLLVMFFTFPYRPELFAFLALFGIETARSSFYLAQSEGSVLISPRFDIVLYNGFLVCGGLCIVYFVGLFLRRPLALITSYLSKRLYLLVSMMVAGYVGLTSIFSVLDATNAFSITVWSLSMWASMELSVPTLFYLFRKKLHIRLVLSCAALAGVAYWACINIHDLFVLTTTITSLNQNHLHFFFFMAIVLAIEIARTEIKIKKALSLLSKEVGQLIHEHQETWHQGFLVLVDIVGSRKTLKLVDEVDRPRYMEKLTAYLGLFFDEPGASLFSGTGDGFYLTFQGEPSQERFQMLVDACNKLARNRPTFKEIGFDHPLIGEQRVIVRSAIAYQKYYTGVSEGKHLKINYSDGSITGDLQRAIGDEKDPQGPRILFSPVLDRYRTGQPALLQETKGETIKYWRAS